MQTHHAHGEGSSPVLYGDTLIVNWDHEGSSFLYAFHRRTGQQLWKVARDEKTTWSTPLIVEHAGRPQIIVSATRRVRGYDLATGALLWECAGLTDNVVSSPVHHDGVIITGNSYYSQAMVAIRLAGAKGDIGPPPAPSPVEGMGGEHVLPNRPASLTISKKAQALIAEHQLDAEATFAGMGLVREVDVIRHLESRIAEHEREHPTPPSPATAGAGAAALEPRAARGAVDSAYPTKSRGLLGDAASSAKDRGNRSVAWLAWNYFWRNWLLGNLARWAPRGVILPIHRMRGVRMGSDVFIDPTAIIETAFPENITIGNDVRITAGCVIMSHIKAPHYLRESGLVPVVLRPVVLEDHCFIGVNSVIMPGVTIGKASVVASGSVVVTNVPAYTMVQGNPAKVIKQFPRPEDRPNLS